MLGYFGSEALKWLYNFDLDESKDWLSQNLAQFVKLLRFDGAD